ncbi:chymotrypsin-2-like [Atheta coriaria]|uniref:chymotrypsin-2-like n=1 Tax=Dalotia coriaria TaxID=877792 RepID=UPI0031F44025
MKATILLCFCALVALTNVTLNCSKTLGTPLNTKIVGGWDAEPGQFKYIVSLRTDYNNYHFCGATIITPRSLVTAAHCKIIDVEYIVAIIGTTRLDDDNARRIPVKEFITHPDYNPSGIINDIAVVILTEDIEFNDMVQPLKLASRKVQDNERLTSSGWGYTSYPGQAPNNLQWMNQNVVNAEECHEMAPGETITGKICVLEMEGHGMCSGDSGGPLVDYYQELVGVTSSAFLCATGKPDFFTDVFYFKTWIEDHIQ